MNGILSVRALYLRGQTLTVIELWTLAELDQKSYRVWTEVFPFPVRDDPVFG